MNEDERAELLKARVSLALRLGPPEGIDEEAVQHDLSLFLGEAFQPYGMGQALEALGRIDDRGNDHLNLIRADAVMDTYAEQDPEVLPDPELDRARRTAAAPLLPPPPPGSVEEPVGLEELLELLERASGEPTREDRWRTLADHGRHLLEPQLLKAAHPQCEGWPVPYGNQPNEYYALITTRFTTRLNGRTEDDFAGNLVPSAWPHCNDFFCGMEYQPKLSGGIPDLQPHMPRWQGVYQEFVGTPCPDGSLDNIYLLIRWRRDPGHLALTYDLFPLVGRPADVEVDAGHVTVSFRPPYVEVRTEKRLRFSKQSGYSDGHSLALLACEMGWIDYVVGMTICAPAVGPVANDGEVGAQRSPPGSSACADNVREVVDRYGAQLGGALSVCRHDAPTSPGVIPTICALGIQVAGDTLRLGMEAGRGLRKLVATGGPFDPAPEPNEE